MGDAEHHDATGIPLHPEQHAIITRPKPVRAAQASPQGLNAAYIRPLGQPPVDASTRAWMASGRAWKSALAWAVSRTSYIPIVWRKMS